MKYKPSLRTTNFLGETLSKNLGQLFSHATDWDLIVPMPSCKKSLKKRGFSHVYEMGLILQRNLPNCRVFDCLQIKQKNRQQAKLPTSLRFMGIKRLMEVRRGAQVTLQGKKILLLDDVITTGATSFAAMKELKKHGATEVDLVSLALGKRWEMFRAKRSRMHTAK